MQKITFINANGQQITFSSTPPFICSNIEELGGIKVNRQEQQSPYQNGSTYIDANLEPKDFPFRFTIKGNNYSEVSERRKILSSLFNPLLGEGVLIYENGYTTKQLVVTCDGGPSFPSGDARRFNYQEGIQEFRAHNPLWQDATETKRSLFAYREGFTFPFSYPKSFGVEGQSAVINNEGDALTPVEIEFYGPSINPVIKNNTTGEFIKIYKTLKADEKVVIDTGFNRKKVEIHKGETVTNAYGFVDWFESDFIQLKPGANEMSYSADSGTEKAVLNIAYRNQFLGV